MWFSLLLILSVDLAGSTLENLTHEWLRDALPVLLVVWNNWARKYFSHRRFVGIEFRTAVPTRTSNSNVAKKEFNWKNLGFRNKKCSKGIKSEIKHSIRRTPTPTILTLFPRWCQSITKSYQWGLACLLSIATEYEATQSLPE